MKLEVVRDKVRNLACGLKLEAQSKDEAALLEVLSEYHLRMVAVEGVTGRYEVVLVGKDGK